MDTIEQEVDSEASVAQSVQPSKNLERYGILELRAERQRLYDKQEADLNKVREKYRPLIAKVSAALEEAEAAMFQEAKESIVQRLIESGVPLEVAILAAERVESTVKPRVKAELKELKQAEMFDNSAYDRVDTTTRRHYLDLKQLAREGRILPGREYRFGDKYWKYTGTGRAAAWVSKKLRDGEDLSQYLVAE